VNPILRESIAKLSVVANVSAGLAHPVDEARAKELFKALHQQGIPLSMDDVYTLAIENQWSDRHATDLAKLADKIGSGGRVQIKHPKGWGEPTVKRIIAELKES